MKFEEFIKMLDECCNDVSFLFEGKNGGIISEVNDYQKTYHVWYDDKMEKYRSVTDVINSKIINGLRLKDIYKEIEFQIS